MSGLAKLFNGGICLARKLKEELNITVSMGKFYSEVVYDYGNININLIAYFCTIVDRIIAYY